MIYKKYNDEIPYRVGDTISFYDWNHGDMILRKGVIRRIDEFGDDYNLHVKCEYVSPLGNSAVVYPLRQEVTLIAKAEQQEENIEEGAR